MAENESKTKTSIKEEEQKNRGPLFAIFQDFLLNFPQFKKENKEVVAVTQGSSNKSDEESKPLQKPDFVKLPDSSRQDFSPLKLTVEESEQGTSSNHLWQVYALGGFMILRWMWARWKESKANDTDKPDSGDEEPSHTDDP